MSQLDVQRTKVAQAASILMQYQINWILGGSPVKIIEKSRRIGLSYAEGEERARKKAFAEAAEQAAETAKQQGLSKTGMDALRAAIMEKL